VARATGGPVRRIVTTLATRTASFVALASALEAGTLVLPRHGDLLRGLLALRVELTVNGEVVQAAGGHVDDIAMALGLALSPFHRDDGVWATYFAWLARQSLADQAPVAWDGPSVGLPDGRVTSVRPGWLSASRRHADLNPPPGARVAPLALEGRVPESGTDARIAELVSVKWTNNEKGSWHE
jgi:hypothetical protein